MSRRSTINLLIFVGLWYGLKAQDAAAVQDIQDIIEAKRLMREAVTHSDGQRLMNAKALLLPLRDHSQLSALVHYYLGYIDYQMAVAIEQLNKERASAYLDSAVVHLEAATEVDKQFAEAYALLASCYGIKISFAPLKGILWGPKSSSLIERAKKLAPRNPRVALLDAIGTYNTPSMFGGGKEKGLQGLKFAAELFDRWVDADSLQPSWGREEVFAWIGRAHMERKEYMLARDAFTRALEINPEYAWVKKSLMPALERRVRAESQ